MKKVLKVKEKENYEELEKELIDFLEEVENYEFVNPTIRVGIFGVGVIRNTITMEDVHNFKEKKLSFEEKLDNLVNTFFDKKCYQNIKDILSETENLINEITRKLPQDQQTQLIEKDPYNKKWLEVARKQKEEKKKRVQNLKDKYKK